MPKPNPNLNQAQPEPNQNPSQIQPRPKPKPKPIATSIQEFCLFGCVGLFTDFYMQLFFYAPILTFDLLRIGSAEKEQQLRRQIITSPVVLENYPPVQCPFSAVFPNLYAKNSSPNLVRFRSESNLAENSYKIDKTHRRTVSNTTAEISLSLAAGISLNNNVEIQK